MKKQNLRTNKLNSNINISFPVGTTISVKNYSKFLEFEKIFSKFKQKGIPLLNLIQAVISYKLTENMSLSRASDWINRIDVLEEFGLKQFEQRTLFRAIETIGENYQTIILDIQDILFSKYDFSHTDVNMDWSSLIIWGDKSAIAKYGYSRDYRPDKKQVTFGVSELRNPINIPIGLTIESGNLNDQNHFEKTFDQIKGRLKEKSLTIFDKGANSKENLNSVTVSKMNYLTAKKLNRSDDEIIKKFWRMNPKLIDMEKGIHGIIQKFPSRTNYFFFSRHLQHKQNESKLRKASRLFREAKEIQKSIDSNKKLPKKYRVNNPLVDMHFSIQTKLPYLSEEEAFEEIKKEAFSGREGFFCLTSSQNLTLEEALKLYREKDSVEKIMHSLKNEICIKPVRVWSTKSIRGVLLIGYLAHLIISLIRYDHKELRTTSTKFIKISLSNLTVTIENIKIFRKRRIYSNFDLINEMICLQNRVKT